MNYDARYILICEAIETALQNGNRDFIIYPFGMNGMMTKSILNERYAIQEKCILDNKLCEFRSDIKSSNDLEVMDIENSTLLLTIENAEYYREILATVKPFFASEHILEIFSKKI